MGRLTLDCNNRIHEGALQSEAPLSAQRWYASGAVFMQLCKAMRARGFVAGNTCCRGARIPPFSTYRKESLNLTSVPNTVQYR